MGHESRGSGAGGSGGGGGHSGSRWIPTAKRLYGTEAMNVKI